MNRDELLKRIWIDPRRCGGKPCIRGHRIWVANDSHLILGEPVMNVVGIPGQNQLLCPDIMAATVRLEAAGIALSGGPMRLGPGMQAIFVRDPDRNVIELHQRG